MELIKITDDHYVVVNGSEIKEGDYCLMFDDYGNLFLGNQPQKYLGEQSGHHLNKGLRKITHSTQPLDERNGGLDFIVQGILELSLQEVKELIGEVDIEKKIDETLEKLSYDVTGDKTADFVDGYVRGYEQALEDNKEKKYTEKQLIWVVQETYDHGRDEVDDILFNQVEESIRVIKKYLQPKTVWGVEFDKNNKLKLK